MIGHAWTVLCQKVITDPRSQNVTMVEALEQVNLVQPPQLPALAAMPLELVSLWYRSNAEVGARSEGRVRILGPTGDQIGESQQFVIDLTVIERARSIAQLPGIPVEGAGRYYFQVDLRDNDQEQWRNVARIPVQVQIYGDANAFLQAQEAARSRAQSSPTLGVSVASERTGR